MKQFVWIIGVFLFLGCREEDRVVTTTLEEKYNSYVTTTNQIMDYIISKSPTVDEVVAYAESLNVGIRVEQKNGILYLIDSANYVFAYDATGVSMRSSVDVSEEDLLALSKDNSELLSILGEDDLTVDSIIGTDALTGLNNQDVLNTRVNDSSKDIRLIRRNILLWSPWKESTSSDALTVKTIITSINGDKDRKSKVKSFAVVDGAKCTPSSIDHWGDYDLVIISSHGSPEGELVIPMIKYAYGKGETTYGSFEKKGYAYRSVILNPNTKRNEKAIFLKKAALKEMLPSMSKSLVWSSVCYAYPSVERSIETWMNALVDKGCPAFYGADGECSNFGTLKMLLNGYMVRLFAGASTDFAFKKAARSEIYNDKSNFFYCVDPGGLKYKYYGYNLGRRIYFPEVLTLPSSKHGKVQYPLSRVTLPKQQVRSRMVSSSLGSLLETSSSTDEFGICVQPVGSGNKQYVPFVSSSVFNYQSVDYSNLITRTFVECNIPDLISGMEYEYQAYMRVDGQLIFDDNSYTFIATDEEGSVFEIYTEEDFKRFRDGILNGNTYKDIDVELMNDITLHDFTYWNRYSDDYEKNRFEGVFNGNNHCITLDYLFKFNSANTYFVTNSLFNSNYGEIVNLKVDATSDVPIGSYEFPGIICKANYGVIRDSEISVDIHKISGWTALICDYNAQTGTISNCLSTGSVDGRLGGSYIGGICKSNDGMITECENRANINGYGGMGGICHQNHGTIEKCYNYGGMGFGSYGQCGGVCSENFESGIIKDCVNYGEVFSFYRGDGAGICGVNRGVIEQCQNEGRICCRSSDGEYNIGLAGICNTNNGKILNCQNTGVVRGVLGISGICSDNRGTLQMCINSGNVELDETYCAKLSGENTIHYVAGICIISKGMNNARAENCRNSGNILTSSKYKCKSGDIVYAE